MESLPPPNTHADESTGGSQCTGGAFPGSRHATWIIMVRRLSQRSADPLPPITTADGSTPEGVAGRIGHFITFSILSFCGLLCLFYLSVFFISS